MHRRADANAISREAQPYQGHAAVVRQPGLQGGICQADKGNGAVIVLPRLILMLDRSKALLVEVALDPPFPIEG
jgi:hypothetical protein